MAKKKVYAVTSTRHRTDSKSTITGTIEELVKAHKYTLECGQSWQHEEGNVKINCNPKTIAVLVKNLNRAVNNSAANGYAGVTYTYEEINNV